MQLSLQMTFAHTKTSSDYYLQDKVIIVKQIWCFACFFVLLHTHK